MRNGLWTCGKDGNDDGFDDDKQRVLSIHSSVVWGHVGNQIATFPLQVC